MRYEIRDTKYETRPEGPLRVLYLFDDLSSKELSNEARRVGSFGRSLGEVVFVWNLR